MTITTKTIDVYATLDYVSYGITASMSKQERDYRIHNFNLIDDWDAMIRGCCRLLGEDGFVIDRLVHSPRKHGISKSRYITFHHSKDRVDHVIKITFNLRISDHPFNKDPERNKIEEDRNRKFHVEVLPKRLEEQTGLIHVDPQYTSLWYELIPYDSFKAMMYDIMDDIYTWLQEECNYEW